MRAYTPFALALLLSLPAHAQDDPPLFNILGQDTETFLDTCVAHFLGKIDLQNPPATAGEFTKLSASEAKAFFEDTKGTAWKVEHHGMYIVALSDDKHSCRVFAQSKYLRTIETEFDWIRDTFFKSIKYVPMSIDQAGPNNATDRSRGFYLPVHRPVWPAVTLTTYGTQQDHGYNVVYTIRYVDASSASGG